MTDMLAAIVSKSDQMNADDLIGQTMTITITDVTIRGGQEQPVSIHFDGDKGKPYKPCKSMSRVLVNVWGADAKKYIGRSLTLYRDPKVTWAGLEVGGIRISHMSDIDSKINMVLTASKSNRKPYIVRPLKAAPTKAAPAHPPPPDGGHPPASATDAASTISVDESIALADRCNENNIKVPLVKKHFGVESFEKLTPAQLVEAHAMIDTTIEKRKQATL